jgi:hypothetical protein
VFAEGQRVHSPLPAEAFRPELWHVVTALLRKRWVEVESLLILQVYRVIAPQMPSHPARQGRRFYWNFRGRCIPPTQ